MPMTGTYPVQDSGEFRQSGEQTNKKKFSGSVEELYNEIEKSIAAGSKENPFKGFEMEIWRNNYDLVDLHKM
jgi:isoleucyl-tRNA synthetase